MFVTYDKLPRSPGHVFYDKLNGLLADGGFDAHVEALCQPYYAKGKGRPSVPPGVYFRMLLVGYFEGINSQRGIAWRCSDSHSLRKFLGMPLGQDSPDHSSLSYIRNRLPLKVHQDVFVWILALAEKKKLLKGKTVAVDSTTLDKQPAPSLENFVTVHSVALLDEILSRRTFATLKPRYMLVGNESPPGEFGPDVIQARSLPDHIEDLPNFQAFTAWYAVWKNSLHRTARVGLLEYDVKLSGNFVEQVAGYLAAGVPVLGFYQWDIRNRYFAGISEYTDELFAAVQSVYGRDMRRQIDGVIVRSMREPRYWLGTTNAVLRADFFERFMRWFTPLIVELSGSAYAGQAFERALSMFLILEGIPFTIASGILHHELANSHGTNILVRGPWRLG